MISADERKVMRERCEAATEGPWYTVENDPEREGYESFSVCRKEPDDLMDQDFEISEFSFMDYAHGFKANAEFCAHARTDLPRLLDEVERLMALNEDKFRTIQAYCKAASEDKAQIERLQRENERLARSLLEAAQNAKDRCPMTTTDTEKRILELQREHAELRTPYRVSMLCPTPGDPFDRCECHVVDVSYSERVIIVERPKELNDLKRYEELDKWTSMMDESWKSTIC